MKARVLPDTDSTSETHQTSPKMNRPVGSLEGLSPWPRRYPYIGRAARIGCPVERGGILSPAQSGRVTPILLPPAERHCCIRRQVPPPGS